MTGTREISRHAVRAELARVAFESFCLSGFDQVTFVDLAEAARVSRSTFLRYFGTKEDVVLFVFDPLRGVLNDAIEATGDGESDWRVLREALRSALNFLVREVANLAVIMDLVGRTPALCARLREKQQDWRTDMTIRLRQRRRDPSEDVMLAEVRVAAALECLWIVLERWNSSGGHDDIDALLDTAIAALAER